MNNNEIKELHFTYNSDKQRNKMEYYEGIALKTTYYLGNYEKTVEPNGSFKEYDYIYTPDGLSAIAIKTNGGSTTMYYVNTDHLGSIRTITDGSKTVYARYSYDAWGVRTETYTIPYNPVTTRGYTGHEHLPEEFGF